MRVHGFTGSEASPFAQVFWKLRLYELSLTKLVSLFRRVDSRVHCV